jgi:two-component system response regulator YesN
MHKVLIVDDEPIVREGLQYIIDWKKNGFEIAGTAENGEEGLRKIETLHPDLVITDIRMPGLTGLEMVEKAKKICQSKFIILSGYSDFKFAQSAISLGTLHYLLKPIEENELISILTEVNQQLNENKVEETKKKEYKEYQELATIRSYVVERKNKEKVRSLLPYTSFQLLRISDKEKKVEESEIANEIDEIIDQKLLFHYGSNVYVLIFEENILEYLKIVEKIANKRRWLMHISACTSDVYQLPKLYQTVHCLNEQEYFYPDQYVFYKKYHRRKKGYCENKENLLQQLKEAIQVNQKELIEKLIETLAGDFQENIEKVTEAKKEWSTIVLECVTYVEDTLSKPIKELEKENIISVIWKESSLYQTAEFLKVVFYDFGRFFYQSQERQTIIDEIKQYTLT